MILAHDAKRRSNNPENLLDFHAFFDVNALAKAATAIMCTAQKRHAGTVY
jgi:hypothetical protein